MFSLKVFALRHSEWEWLLAAVKADISWGGLDFRHSGINELGPLEWLLCMQRTVNQGFLKYVKWVEAISPTVLFKGWNHRTHPVSMHTDAQMPQKLLSGLYQGWTYSCFVKYHYLVLGIGNMSSNLFQSFWNILLAWNGAERTFKTNETRQQTLVGMKRTTEVRLALKPKLLETSRKFRKIHWLIDTRGEII